MRAVISYRVPMQAAISPMFCIAFMMFFFIVIKYYLLKVGEKSVCFLAADVLQHLAVVSHGLNQILNNSVLHNKNTSKIECEKFCMDRRER